MLNQTDSKQNNPDKGSDEFSYKFPGGETSYSGECLNVNGSNIVFIAEQFIESGKAIEVTIERKNALTAAMIAYVEVLGSDEMANHMFEVTSEIKGIKGN